MNHEARSLQRVAAVLLGRAGLRLGPDGYPGLKMALKARIEILGVGDYGEYARLVEADAAELHQLLPLVTVGKTEFFRDTHQFRALASTVFPEIQALAQREGRPVKFWSAGCSTGEEPYSLAMLSLEGGGSPDSVEILGTDVNPTAIEFAQRAQYEDRRLLGLSAERLQQFFSKEGTRWGVRAELRQLVRFALHNLAAPTWAGVQAHSFDVIFCRNVAIYFDEKTKLAVMERFFETLHPGGWLFLGYSESLFRNPTRFQMVEVDGAFLYRRPPSFSAAPAEAPTVESAAPGDHVALSPSPLEPLEEPLLAVHRLLEQGEFSSAESALSQLIERAPTNLEAWLTWGNLKALKGDIAGARAVYQLVVDREPLSVEPHLFSALAYLQAGASGEAQQALRAALFLDPTSAVAHLVLGQAYEVEGKVEAAARAYERVLSLRSVHQRHLRGFFPELPRASECLARVAKQRLWALGSR